MTRRMLRAALGLGLLTSPFLFQSCFLAVDGYPPVFVDFRHGFPHFDGDGEDSFLDRLFGFDDDD